MNKYPAICIGDTFSRLMVIEKLPRRSYTLWWLCRCTCGQEKAIRDSLLKSGQTRSCGCLAKEVNTIHGNWRSRTYKSWQMMKDRCQNSQCPEFSYYGGRGISVCARWQVFENFLTDMGNRPPRTSIERIDNNGNYEPNNCRWATRHEQMNNTRANRLITFNNQTLNVSQWAKKLGINRNTLYVRLFRGQTAEQAFQVQK